VDAVDRRPAYTVDEVELRLDVLAGGAGVDPVATVGAGVEAAGGGHGRERLSLDRHPPPRRDAVDHRRLQHVRAGVDEVARRLAPGRLLDERGHPAPGVGEDDAVAGRIVDPMQRDGALCGSDVVEGDERRDVEVREHVPVDDQEALIDPGVEGGVADGSRSVQRLGLDRIVQRGAGAPPAGVDVTESVGLVAERQHHVVDAVGGQVPDDVLDHRPVDDRQHLLGPVVGQGA
jgi:hypothetical protein